MLATDRNDCYEFHCSCHGDGSDTHITYKNNDGTNAVIYGEKYQITDLIHGGIENYRHCETTAFFMQYLARLASSANEGFNAIPTALTFLAPKYGKHVLTLLHIRYLTLPLHISRCHTISYQINKQED